MHAHTRFLACLRITRVDALDNACFKQRTFPKEAARSLCAVLVGQLGFYRNTHASHFAARLQCVLSLCQSLMRALLVPVCPQSVCKHPCACMYKNQMSTHQTAPPPTCTMRRNICIRSVKDITLPPVSFSGGLVTRSRPPVFWRTSQVNGEKDSPNDSLQARLHPTKCMICVFLSGTFATRVHDHAFKPLMVCICMCASTLTCVQARKHMFMQCWI